MDICGKDALWIPEGNCECGEGGGPAITKVLYSQLVALQQASMLEPGMQYRIIDYECTTTQEGSDVIPHPFDIVVVADDENTLNENARAMLRDSDVYYSSNHTNIDAWELKYTVDNDQSRFGWADPVNGKGVVYYMKDDHGNEAPYDFKQIMFARYQVQYAYGHGGPIDSWATPTMAAVFPEEEPLELDQIPTYFYTFSFEDNGVITDNSVTQEADCFENVIRSQHPEVGQWEFGKDELPDVVFIETTLWRTPYDTARHGTTQNTLGAGCHDITFSASTHNNTLGENVRSSMFMSQFVDNTIGDYCYGLFLGHTSNDNVIGESSHSFIWDGYHMGNVVGPWCSNIYLASACSNNTFDSNCAYIELGGYSGSNMFNSDCGYIEVPGTASHNNFGLSCHHITSVSGLVDITCGSNCSYIDLGSGVRECSFGNDCDSIELQDGIIHSTFEDGVRYVRVNTAGTGFSHHVQNYYFLTGTQGELNDYIEINGVLDNNFTTYVGLNSQGNLEIWNPADGGVPVGAPVIVNSVSAMTDTSKIYLYIGSEAGYTAGDWYYWDGAAWVSGGVYGGSSVVIDNTLTRTGEAADAKATGDAIAAVQADIETVLGDIANVESGNTATQNYPVGDYVIVNHQLYRVISAIANGGTFTPGTNIESIAVEDVLKDLEDRKADKDGYYPDMTVGNAEQLVSTVYVEDNDPYVFRTSGGSADIGNREQDTLVGGTIAWNQLLPNGDFSNGTTGWSVQALGLSYSVSDNVFTYTVTDNTRQARPNIAVSQTLVPPIIGHKYLAAADVKITTSSTASLSYGFLFGNVYKNLYSGLPKNVWNNAATIISVASLNYDFTLYVGSYINVLNNNDTIQYRNAMLIDLTQMFGTTIADYIYSLETSTPGAGVAWFKRLFPKPYYAYNAGELMSVNAISHDMVGFNQWDEEWEPGVFNTTTGANASSSTQIRAKNLIPILPNTEYYFETNNIHAWVLFYDKDRNVLQNAYVSVTRDGNASSVKDMAFTSPDNAYYFRFYMVTAYGTTYKHDICINLSWSGTRNGEYEPYRKSTYALADIYLRGIPKLDSANQLYYDGDVYEADGTVTRKYGILDMGGITWTMYTVTQGNLFRSPTMANTRYDSMNFVCSKYATTTASLRADKTISCGSDGRVDVIDNTYSSAADFKTAMSGVYLVYELATPTTETADPYAVNEWVDDWGTEEYVDGDYSDGTRDVAVPVGHETKYPANLRDKLQHLPNLASSDGTYVIAQSGSNMVLTPLITPTELPTAPSTDGTYRLIATVSGGNVTYSWTNN